MSLNENNENSFADLTRRVQQALRLAKLTPEQAQAEYDAAEPADISDADIERLIANVVDGDESAGSDSFEVTEWTLDVDTEEVESGFLQLNRNQGNEDPEVDELIEKHRREALDQNDDDEDSSDTPEDTRGG